MNNQYHQIPVNHSLYPALCLIAASGLTATMISLPVAAQDEDSAQNVERIIVIGSRRHSASPADIPSPVDVIDADTLRQQGSTDMVDLMRTLVPSFNVSAHPVSGTSSLVRPANLRGLGADHTLILVNGKRRHRGANIPNFSGGINDGTQGADISSLPSIALKRVEILRDGAAAQYGADAIAGVINFIAQDDPQARSLEIKLGQYYQGDGETVNIAGTFGFALPGDGSLNLSAEFNDNKRALRAQQSDSTQAFVDAGYSAIRDPAILWGTPEIKDDLKLFVNIKQPLGNAAELYGYYSYNERENISGFFFRNPARAGVFALGDERIVFDTTADGSGNCPALSVPDLSDPAAVAADLAAIEALRGNPACFSFLEDFGGGTAPFFSGINEDDSISLGLRGDYSDDLIYDVSYTRGENTVIYRTFDNFNPTFGPDSPNFLVAGSRQQTEQTLNAELTYITEAGFESALNIALGFEWREEKYRQTPGQLEAYGVGPYTQTAQGTPGISVGTLGFGSFSPGNSFAGSRHNNAFYIDAESEVIEDWTVAAAIRHENFSDVGNDTNYKLSSLFKINDSLGIRGTYSTGFHVPTPGQRFFAQSTVGFDANGVLSTSSTLPVSIAGQLPSFSQTAQPLSAETSRSLGLGMVWESDDLSLTLDYFNIDVDDRITLTSTFAVTDSDRAALFNAGLANANQFIGINFFTNDFDTGTEGVDLIASLKVASGYGGESKISLSANYTDTQVTRRGADLSDLRVLQLEKQLPKVKGALAFNHNRDKFNLIARINYFGSLSEYYLSTTRVTRLASQITFDLELSCHVTESMQFIIGGQNVFNSFPSKAVYAAAFGSTYPVSAPAGFGGGFYYLELKYDF